MTRMRSQAPPPHTQTKDQSHTQTQEENAEYVLREQEI